MRFDETAKKDWTGKSRDIYVTMGATGHGLEDREENDFYATDPKATEMLLDMETFNHKIWEPACGELHITKVLKARGYDVWSTDLVNRKGCADKELDFLSGFNTVLWDGDIVTNPPYSIATEFIVKALSLVKPGAKIAMFLKVQFLEGKERRKLFDVQPFKTLYVSTSRISCAKNGDFEKYPGSAVCFCWYVWEKGFQGAPTIKWFN